MGGFFFCRSSTPNDHTEEETKQTFRNPTPKDVASILKKTKQITRVYIIQIRDNLF